MNTRERIIGLLIESREPLTAGDIAIKLNRTNSDIRKILSNLCKEGKIQRLAYGKYSSVNVDRGNELNELNQSVNVLSNQSVNVVNESVNVKELARKLINEAHRKYYADHREQIRKYQKEWRDQHSDYNKLWLREFRKKYPGKQKEYDARYWLKKAMELKAMELREVR